MELSLKEKKILKEFKRRIKEKYSDEIQDMLVFGSKARGDATEESDIDTIIVILSDDWRKGDEIREIGYKLDEESGEKTFWDASNKNREVRRLNILRKEELVLKEERFS